ncbi:MAG: response regulator [Bacteroidetes bacterium]|nr:response regulator [Bacteroidota bacterium]
MDSNLNFILVDDDGINNTLCRAVITKVFEGANVKAFQIPEEALAYIQDNYASKEDFFTTLFLDINMPSMTGWEFIEEFNKFPDKIKKQFTIYMLSSSVDNKDMERAGKNNLIKCYISKPLKRETLKVLLLGEG